MDADDVSRFPALVKTTDQWFTIEEASADKTYVSSEIFQALADCDASGYTITAREVVCSDHL